MTNPPWGETPPADGKEFLKALWRYGREKVEEKKRVVDAVAAESVATREQKRHVFVEEMRRRGVPPDPVWVEQKLDALERSDAERWRVAAEVMPAVGAAVARIVRSHGVGDPPAWMAPPAHASHHIWGADWEKTAIEIDPQAVGVLDRALAESPARVGKLTALIDVWFDRDEATESGALAVLIGSHRVGAVTGPLSQRLQPIMQAAEDLNARPFAKAQLATAPHLQPPYLLVAELPVDQQHERA